MKKLIKALCVGGFAVLMLNMASSAVAQERRGNFDPEQFRERMMERLREQFEVTNDDEWKIISPRLEKVMQMRMRAQMASFAGFGRGGAGGRTGGRGGFPGAEPEPAVEDLQKAIDAKASPQELKEKMEKVRQARKDREAELAKAQKDLRDVLSVRQEATAVLMGFLP